MEAEGVLNCAGVTEWIQQLHYGKSMHARAVEREAIWKEHAVHWERVARQHEKQIQELTAQVEALQAKVV